MNGQRPNDSLVPVMFRLYSLEQMINLCVIDSASERGVWGRVCRSHFNGSDGHGLNRVSLLK